ncbi:TetR/AcrR family transcriptional regulator [Nocardia sp. NPDC003482]
MNRSASVAHETSDKRRLRGARTRRIVALHAANVASLEGLEGLSLGRLATDLGMSKSGVQGLFVTKEKLQLAAVNAAREAVVENVVDPTRSVAPGLARLHALFRQYIVYVTKPLFPGGCFRAANLAHIDRQPEIVRKALLRDSDDWLEMFANQLRIAVDNGEVADIDIELAVFEIDAVLLAVNTRVRLGDPAVIEKMPAVLGRLLVSPSGDPQPFPVA